MIDTYGGHYTTLEKLVDYMAAVKRRTAYHDGPTGGIVLPEHVWSMISGYSLVVLDEIGARAPSDHAYETLQAALDTRASRPSIYISNLPISEIAAVYDDRIASRLAAGSIYQTESTDRRIVHHRTWEAPE